MADEKTYLERAKAALEDAFAEQLKARFTWLNNDVEGHANHVAELAGDVVKFESGMRDLKAMYEAALKIIDKVF
jgi:hypothetical protein